MVARISLGIALQSLHAKLPVAVKSLPISRHPAALRCRTRSAMATLDQWKPWVWAVFAFNCLFATVFALLCWETYRQFRNVTKSAAFAPALTDVKEWYDLTLWVGAGDNKAVSDRGGVCAGRLCSTGPLSVHFLQSSWL